MPGSSHAPNGSDEARRVAPSGAAVTASRAFAAVGVGLAVIGAVSTALVHIDRARYDASLTVQALTDRLRDDVDIVRPRSVDIWLRGSR